MARAGHTRQAIEDELNRLDQAGKPLSLNSVREALRIRYGIGASDSSLLEPVRDYKATRLRKGKKRIERALVAYRGLDHFEAQVFRARASLAPRDPITPQRHRT